VLTQPAKSEVLADSREYSSDIVREQIRYQTKQRGTPTDTNSPESLIERLQTHGTVIIEVLHLPPRTTYDFMVSVDVREVLLKGVDRHYLTPQPSGSLPLSNCKATGTASLARTTRPRQLGVPLQPEHNVAERNSLTVGQCDYQIWLTGIAPGGTSIDRDVDVEGVGGTQEMNVPS